MYGEDITVLFFLLFSVFLSFVFIRIFGLYFFILVFVLSFIYSPVRVFAIEKYRILKVKTFSVDTYDRLSLNIVSTEDDRHILDLLDVRNIVEALIYAETYCSARDLYLEGVHLNFRYSMPVYNSCVTQAFSDLAFFNRKDLRSSLLIFLSNSSSLTWPKSQSAVFCSYIRKIGGIKALDKLKSCQ